MSQRMRGSGATGCTLALPGLGRSQHKFAAAWLQHNHANFGSVVVRSG